MSDRSGPLSVGRLRPIPPLICEPLQRKPISSESSFDSDAPSLVRIGALCIRSLESLEPSILVALFKASAMFAKSREVTGIDYFISRLAVLAPLPSRRPLNLDLLLYFYLLRSLDPHSIRQLSYGRRSVRKKLREDEHQNLLLHSVPEQGERDFSRMLLF